jgi:hypothetical protein
MRGMMARRPRVRSRSELARTSSPLSVLDVPEPDERIRLYRPLGFVAGRRQRLDRIHKCTDRVGVPLHRGREGLHDRFQRRDLLGRLPTASSTGRRHLRNGPMIRGLYLPGAGRRRRTRDTTSLEAALGERPDAGPARRSSPSLECAWSLASKETARPPWCDQIFKTLVRAL